MHEDSRKIYQWIIFIVHVRILHNGNDSDIKFLNNDLNIKNEKKLSITFYT